MASNLIPKGYTVVEDSPASKIKDWKFVPILKDGEASIDSKTLFQRAKEMNANFGLSDAEFLLKHQDKIPKELQDKYTTFPATVLRDSVGRLHVPCLHFLGGRWVLHFRWLVRDWDGDGRLACSESGTCSPDSQSLESRIKMKDGKIINLNMENIKNDWIELDYLTGLSIQELLGGKSKCYETKSFVNKKTGEIRQFLITIVERIGTEAILKMLNQGV